MRLIDADALKEEMRIHCCGYFEDVLECIMRAPTISTPPNDPLALSELWEMDGEPVWDKDGNCFIVRINVVRSAGYGADKFATYTKLDILCKRGLYRRKPEEGTT